MKNKTQENQNSKQLNLNEGIVIVLNAKSQPFISKSWFIITDERIRERGIARACLFDNIQVNVDMYTQFYFFGMLSTINHVQEIQ